MISFDQFERYFEEGHGQLWERLALCKSRPVLGRRQARRATEQLIGKILAAPAWTDEMAAEIAGMRLRMEETAAPSNLKRGPGGHVDIEFVVQMLQLKHGGDFQSTGDAGRHPGASTPELAARGRRSVFRQGLPVSSHGGIPPAADEYCSPARFACGIGADSPTGLPAWDGTRVSAGRVPRLPAFEP